jgi:hypothetical protein
LRPIQTGEGHRNSKNQVKKHIIVQNLQIDNERPLNHPFQKQNQVTNQPTNTNLQNTNNNNDENNNDGNNNNDENVSTSIPKLINSNTIVGTLFAIVITLCVLISLYYIRYIKRTSSLTKSQIIDRYSSQDEFMEFRKMNSNERRRSSMSKIDDYMQYRGDSAPAYTKESTLTIPIIVTPSSDYSKSVRSQSLDTERISRFFNNHAVESLNYGRLGGTVDRVLHVTELARAYALEQRLSYDSANDSVIEEDI